SDPKKRKIYDQVGFYSDNIDPAAAEAYARAGATGTGGFPGGFQGGQAEPGGQGVHFDFGGFDFSDLSEGGRAGRRGGAGSGSFRDIFSGIFGGRGGAPAAEGPEPGSDLEYQVNVPFWTAIRGGVMRLNITRHDTCGNCQGKGYVESPGKCPECNGTGQVTQTGGRMKFNVTCPRCHGTGKNLSSCPDCHGEGVIERTEPLEVRIKPGTRDGQRIRIAGKGNAGSHGGAAGDLYVIIRAGTHPIFRREGDDIHLTVPVTTSEAALGAKIEVPTIDGRAMLKIPPGTQSGQKLRLREKGVPSATKDGVRGDEIVEVKVTVPMPRDEKTKELLRELAKLNPEDPRAELFKNI
ncbi:MAG TPA: DnaJ C-terminal domain-containing protein, partial [Terriglobales bacterium]|nr:DnaJ C-terminal domain-containing protein [Terriglobales bacterium]